MEGTSTLNQQTPELAHEFGTESSRLDPVYQLSKLFGKIVWKHTLIAHIHNKCCFNVSIFTNGKWFRSTGNTLAKAKRTCALLALSNYYNTINNENLLISEPRDKKVCDDQIVISDDEESKNIPKIDLPEEPKVDGKITPKNNKLKPLRNIKNFEGMKKSKSGIASKISELKNCTIQPIPKTSKIFFKKVSHYTRSELKVVLKTKLNSVKVDIKTSTTSTFETMDLVDVKSVQAKVPIKSFARNPIKAQDVESNKAICLDSTIDNQKRPREEDESELNTLPQAKRHAITSEAEVGTALDPPFTMPAMLGDRKFVGNGNNYLENNTINTTKTPVNSVLQANNQEFQIVIMPNPQENEVSSTLLLPSNKCDIIESKIMQRFDEITYTQQKYRRYKVLAGIVMTHNLNFENSVVISIATGTKCVLGDNTCSNGTVLNDSHAEIIAKRGLMRFLFDNLAGSSFEYIFGIQIFQRNPNNSKVPFKLNPNIHFHLYINTAPCGDARVYNFNNKYLFNGTHYGQLRTKIEGELGTQPIGSRYCYQTWLGLQSGEPLHTMSCSDKIALWNVVGVQGALLSQFIEPIYLYSIVLGSMFNAQHLYRAICGRIEHSLGYLPEPYRLHRPLLGQTSKKLLRGCIYRAPVLGINWSMGDNSIEVISLRDGCTTYNQISNLTKHVFFYKFTYLWKYFQYSTQIYNYAEAKKNAKDFQTCKREVFDAFYRAGLGVWIKKPIEQNQFFPTICFYNFGSINPPIIYQSN